MFFTSKTMRFKINAVLIITGIATALVWIAIFYPFEKQRQQSRLHNIRILLQTIYEQKKDDLANEMFARQDTAIRLTLEKIHEVKGVAGLSVHDLDGRLVATTRPGGGVPVSEKEKLQLAQAPIFLRRADGQQAYATFTTIVEVVGERVGYFRVYYDLLAMERESLMTMISFVVLIFLTLTLTMLLLNLFLARTVIAPTTALREAIVRLRSGEWGQKVDLKSDDEIGEVAQAFNDMSARLGEQHRELLQAVDQKDQYATELETTNRALADLNAHLEEMVDGRTAELRHRNEQLNEEIRERQLAEETNRELQEMLNRSQKMEALGLLAGGVAHDLNNVLSGLVSYPDLLLLDMPPDHRLRRPVETIRSSGLKASAIVQDLLTLARRGVVNPVVIDFNKAVVEEHLDSPEHHKMLSFHPKVVVQPELASDLKLIQGSKVHLRKTLMNLVSNAVEAQPAGGLVLISTRNQYVDTPLTGYSQVQEGEYVVLEVTDHGTGIEPQDMERIFEPFYTKKIMGRSGTGLGMAVVWGTVQDHDGYINVHSTPGRGTTFLLYFPVTSEPLPGESALSRPSDFQGSGQTVLVVDDVEQQRQIATEMLTRLNYRVEAVDSGEAAVDYLRLTPVDMVVLDMIMDPGMDGLETYEEILKLHPAQKVVIASGYAENERVKKAQSLGAGAFIKKPYTTEEIGRAIHTTLDCRHS